MYQKTRKILFLGSVVLFMFLLPAILLFTFGYKVDWNNLRILKTGLIWINSSPEGADVYVSGRFTNKKTPATVDELLPGNYTVSLVHENYYPWQADVSVYQGRVVSISNIMLFPRIPQFEKLNFEEAGNFFVFNHENNLLYYIIKGTKIIHKVNSDSGRLEGVINADIFPGEILNISLSPDRKKLICNDSHNLALIYLSKEPRKDNFLINCRDNIQQVFWHSDSEHFIVVTNRDIKVYELFAQGKSNVIILTKLSGRSIYSHYDPASDTLLFSDLQQASDGRRYENIYKIVIGSRFSFPFFKGFQNK